MKRFAILALMAAFVMSSAVVSAADLSVSGSWRVVGQFTNNEKGGKHIEEDHFKLASRARTTFEFVANEHLKAVTELEFANKSWNNTGDASDNGKLTPEDESAVIAKDAYIAFDAPNTAVNIQAGIQGFATPSATEWWAPYDETAGGIVVAAPFNDMMTLNVAYFRLEDKSEVGGAKAHDESDLLYFGLTMKTDQFEVTPWLLYNQVAKNSGDKNTMFLAVSGSMNMDPLTLAGDLYYGNTSSDDKTKERSAFGLVVSAAYAMDMFTPEAYLGYFSGAGKDNTDVMPSISGDTYKTKFLFDGSSLGAGNVAPDNGVHIATQSLFLGVALKDITLVEGLKHDFNVVYLMGTNNKDNANLGYTADNKVLSFDFSTKYQIYEQLAAIAELGYAKYDAKATADEEDKFGLAFGIKYDF